MVYICFGVLWNQSKRDAKLITFSCGIIAEFDSKETTWKIAQLAAVQVMMWEWLLTLYNSRNVVAIYMACHQMIVSSSKVLQNLY